MALGLGIVGMILNALPVELASGVHLLFGHLPVLGAAFALGPAGGALAGLIAGSVTLPMWGHPWAWVIFVVEGAAVGLLSRRFLPLPALAFFWLVAGPIYTALLWLTYPLGIASLVMVKYVSETLLVALIWQGALMIPAFRGPLRAWLPPPVRHVRVGTALRTLLTLAATLPLLVLAATEARLLYTAYVQQIDHNNERTIRWVAPAIENILADVSEELDSSAADLALLHDPREMQPVLAALLKRGTGLHSVAVVDDTGRPILVAGRISTADAAELAHAIQGHGFNVLPEASAAFRIAAARPLDGEPRRLIGVLDLPALVERLELTADPDAKLLIIDESGAVLADSKAVAGPIRPLDESQRGAIERAGSTGLSTYLQDGSRYRTLMPQNTVRIAVAPIPSMGWRAVVERAQASIQPELERALAGLAAGLGVALILILLTAIALSGAVITPVRAVSEAAARIQRGDRRARAVETDDIPEEIQQLSQGFNLMAEEVGRKLDVAESANRQKDEFLSIASHELKSPLTTMKTQVQILQRRVEPEDAKRLHSLVQQIDKLSRLIGQLLDASALGAGMFTLSPTQVELEPLLRRVAEGLVNASPIHRLDLSLEAVTGCWDEIRLEQVLHNLVANAVKYSPQGGPIEVEDRVEGNEVVIRVADRGIGIPAEKTDELFGRFARGEGARGMAGMGVGLYVSKEIVTRHGGRIAMFPREGGGTEVVLRLPVRRTAVPSHNG